MRCQTAALVKRSHGVGEDCLRAATLVGRFSALGIDRRHRNRSITCSLSLGEALTLISSAAASHRPLPSPTSGVRRGRRRCAAVLVEAPVSRRLLPRDDWKSIAHRGTSRMPPRRWAGRGRLLLRSTQRNTPVVDTGRLGDGLACPRQQRGCSTTAQSCADRAPAATHQGLAALRRGRAMLNFPEVVMTQPHPASSDGATAASLPDRDAGAGLT